jgi:hypothetical protein
MFSAIQMRKNVSEVSGISVIAESKRSLDFACCCRCFRIFDLSQIRLFLGAMFKHVVAIACLLLLGVSLAVAQNTAKPATKPKTEPFTTGSSPALDVGTTPRIDSPEWKKEQAESERKEQLLKSKINSICRGC